MSRVLRSVTTPLLVLLAEKDEYADRPAEDIAAWFAANHRSSRFASAVVPGVGHGFQGAEAQTARTIRKWINA